MPKAVRTGVCIDPDRSRVLIRPFIPFEREQSQLVLARIASLSDEEVAAELSRVLLGFSARHISVEDVFLHRYRSIQDWRFTDEELSRERQLLIGAYFTSEYSLECAALFNPCLIPHPDQEGIPHGSLRFIMSLRAVGEGHVSSIGFREGVIDKDHNITIEAPSRVVMAPEPMVTVDYNKPQFLQKVYEMGVENDYCHKVLALLDDAFNLAELRQAISKIAAREPKIADTHSFTRDTMLWIALSNYEIEFPDNVPLSGRVIFPNAPSELNGIEDARFVKFIKDDESFTYYATYTAYSGRSIMPQLLETRDFKRFEISTLSGKAIENKGMALFPRKIDGFYAMLSRQDGENIYLMYSGDMEIWREKIPLARPTYPWQFIKLGNCGSPIPLEEGWLVIDHGVGPMRRYCIGAFLLDKNDPSRMIGRLKEPILEPEGNEREGYVPNVVYSCGSLVHNGKLILPYAMADYASRIATIDLKELLSAM